MAFGAMVAQFLALLAAFAARHFSMSAARSSGLLAACVARYLAVLRSKLSGVNVWGPGTPTCGLDLPFLNSLCFFLVSSLQGCPLVGLPLREALILAKCSGLGDLPLFQAGWPL